MDTLTGWIDGLGLGLDSSPTHAPAPEPTPTPTSTPAPNDEAKVLVAYFSATNTTKPLAEYITDGLDADIYEIVPATPYTSADLNYSNSSSRATVEQNNPSARPAISNSVSGMEQYDVVFLGYPIWWGQAPRIVSTFLESYDFNGIFTLINKKTPLLRHNLRNERSYHGIYAKTNNERRTSIL